MKQCKFLLYTVPMTWTCGTGAKKPHPTIYYFKCYTSYEPVMHGMLDLCPPRITTVPSSCIGLGTGKLAKQLGGVIKIGTERGSAAWAAVNYLDLQDYMNCEFKTLVFCRSYDL